MKETLELRSSSISKRKMVRVDLLTNLIVMLSVGNKLVWNLLGNSRVVTIPPSMYASNEEQDRTDEEDR